MNAKFDLGATQMQVSIQEFTKCRMEIQLNCYKIWCESAIKNKVNDPDLINWIEKTYNVAINQMLYEHLIGIFNDMMLLNNAEKLRKIEKEIKDEDELDPRFQKLAQEIDELKEEIKVLKSMVYEKSKN